MAKVKYNEDKLKNSLQPAVGSSLANLNNAIAKANSVNFPDGDLGWGSVKNELNDCLTNTRKYSNWLNDISEKFSNTFLLFDDNINKVKVEAIKSKDSIVK